MFYLLLFKAVGWSWIQCLLTTILQRHSNVDSQLIYAHVDKRWISILRFFGKML